MFNFLKKEKLIMNKEKIAELLKTTPEALAAFEATYQKQLLSEPISDNLFNVNAKQAAELNAGVTEETHPDLDDIIRRIVNELVAQTSVWSFDGKSGGFVWGMCEFDKTVTLEEIKALPEELQPQLSGNLTKRDISEPAYIMLLEMYQRYLSEKNPKKRKGFYDMFRQGLDILDLDPVTYEIIGTNPNSMGYWLPKIVPAAAEQGFFKIPKTTIIKVPLTLLQLTRLPYEEMTRTTLDIVDLFCQKVFSLDESKTYFIKTGTYSSKYDFRNAKVHSPKEVRELGEYLLFIHFQALMMASPFTSPCRYGVSTTNEWVVREFIEDTEGNPTIYMGLPLRTEYRVFVDFDTKEVIGIHPYWDPEIMKNHFLHNAEDDVHNKHDYITYLANEEKLMKRYNDNKDIVIKHMRILIQNIDITGQWSVDLMQNGSDFWLIDMHQAQVSAYYKECVPENLRVPLAENWIPEISQLVRK